MATVVFSSELQRLTGEEQVSIRAESYRELLDALTSRYDKLERDALMKMAIAVDGEIIHDPLLEKIDEQAEVHFLERISGG